jgi:hypothetical protein
MANGIFNSVGVASFPVAPNPAAGTYYFGIDSTDGHLKVQNSSGTVTDYQSGASYSDPDAVAAIQAAIIAAASETEPTSDDFLYLRDVSGSDFNKVTKKDLQKADPDRLFQLHSDFIGTAAGEFTQYISGTGASVQTGTYGQDATNNALGVTQVDTGTTATGRAGLGMISGAVVKPTLARLLWCARTAIEAVSSVSDTYTVRQGLGDFYVAGADGTNGLFFRYTDLVNGGRWQCVSRAGGADLTVVDSGVSPDLDYHVYEVDLSEDGTTCLFKIDGATVATISSPNLPGIANTMGAGFQIVKSVGLNQRNLSTDWMIMRIERAAVR